MKKDVLKWIAAFVAFAFGLTLSSCGDDKDEPEEPQSKYSRVEVKYAVSLSQDYYDLWDIQVSYTDYAGNIKSETITQDWSMKFTYNATDEFPTNYSLVVKGLPKNPAPSVDQEKVYTLSSDCSMMTTGFTREGKSDILGMALPQANRSVRGDHLTNHVANGINIAQCSYQVDLSGNNPIR